MFSKSKIKDTAPKPSMGEARPTPAGGTAPMGKPAPAPSVPPLGSGPTPGPSAAPKSKPAPSTLSSDLVVKGNMKTTGDIQIEGMVDGDIRAHLLTVGEGATVKGEIVADDVVVNGRVIGRVRGLKVRLTSTARVEGDIIHKTIAIESGAHFEGSVQRQDDPLNTKVAKPAPKAAPSSALAPTPSATGK
ncbi:MAG: cytoskeletal protein CcmA (bactofilin family) [Paracoccaceae bacterium]|jgi:cytoskeletal protein CcmA (bactofilin family)